MIPAKQDKSSTSVIFGKKLSHSFYTIIASINWWRFYEISQEKK
jgi:hypothetical protein